MRKPALFHRRSKGAHRVPTIAELKSRLDAALETDWTEPATDLAVDELGRLLGLPLSKSFCEFLTTCGAGGVVPMTDISGILDGEPASRNRGSVLGDTLRCRDEFDLPAPYVVVFFDEDVETMWCLETSKMKNGECPVVSWEPFEKQTYPMFPTFAAFFEHYVTSHLESHALDHSLCRAKGIWEHTHAHGPIARLWRKIGLMNAVHGIWICRYAEGDWNTAHFAGEPVQIWRYGSDGLKSVNSLPPLDLRSYRSKTPVLRFCIDETGQRMIYTEWHGVPRGAV